MSTHTPQTLITVAMLTVLYCMLRFAKAILRAYNPAKGTTIVISMCLKGKNFILSSEYCKWLCYFSATQQPMPVMSNWMAVRSVPGVSNWHCWLYTHILLRLQEYSLVEEAYRQYGHEIQHHVETHLYIFVFFGSGALGSLFDNIIISCTHFSWNFKCLSVWCGWPFKK